MSLLGVRTSTDVPVPGDKSAAKEPRDMEPPTSIPSGTKDSANSNQDSKMVVAKGTGEFPFVLVNNENNDGKSFVTPHGKHKVRITEYR